MVSDAAAALAVATSPERAGKKLESEIHQSQLKPLQDKLIRPSGCANWCIALGAIIIGAEIL